MNSPETPATNYCRVCCPKLAAFYRYWQSLRSDGLLPGRADIRPEAIPELLARVWLVDIERDPLRFRIRLVGSDHYTTLGADLTGRYLAPEMFGDSWDIVLEAHTKVAETGLPHFGISRFEQPDGGPGSVVLESVVLPLAQDGRRVDMVIGCQAVILEGTTAHALRHGLVRDQRQIPLMEVAPLTDEHLPPPAVESGRAQPGFTYSKSTA